VDRLQSGVERERIRRHQKCPHTSDAIVETGHSYVQQVRAAIIFNDLLLRLRNKPLLEFTLSMGGMAILIMQ